MSDESPVQEAWAAFELWPGGLSPEQRRVLNLKARALALATAKAILPPRSHPGAKTGIERRYLALKAQIERLGR